MPSNLDFYGEMQAMEGILAWVVGTFRTWPLAEVSSLTRQSTTRAPPNCAVIPLVKLGISPFPVLKFSFRFFRQGIKAVFLNPSKLMLCKKHVL